MKQRSASPKACFYKEVPIIYNVLHKLWFGDVTGGWNGYKKFLSTNPIQVAPHIQANDTGIIIA